MTTKNSLKKDHKKLPKFDSSDDLGGGFQNLMQHRVHHILLVSSLYDSFNLFQDAQLSEMILTEFVGLNIFQAPTITRVSSANKALKLLRKDSRFDLVITSLRVGKMNVVNFARRLKKISHDLPLILLSHDSRELFDLREKPEGSLFDKIFLWQGDFRLLIGIIKYVEDRMNVEHDTLQMGVQIILLIEDNLKFYSSYLPMIYTEVMRHSQRLITEGVNRAHRYLRMRARPKILWCENFEEAWAYFERYERYVLGVITDVEFPRNGVKDPSAGAKFARRVKATRADIPVVLQSFQKENAAVARDLSVGFIQKDSPDLLKRLRNFMQEHLGFGDFIFCLPERRMTERAGDYLLPARREIDSAVDLYSLEKKLDLIPDDSLRYHSERNHFSTWLKARTEFDLAEKLRPRRVSDYGSLSEVRSDIINQLRTARRERNRRLITDFNSQSFDMSVGFSRIGGGSLGGKARGLAFISHFINHYKLHTFFPNVTLTVPQTIVVCTDVFDDFMDANDLFNMAVKSDDDAEIKQAFFAADLPDDIMENLKQMLEKVTVPLAVRSSSLLEDSQYQPFAGVYSTFMLPNNNSDWSVRLRDLVGAIKRVYASVYFKKSKQYMQATPYRLEEEKMAVIIQRLVGAEHNGRFYPDISGVAKSHNFYPLPPTTHDDGTASIALGLGQVVVEGGDTIIFSPKFPEHAEQYSSTQNLLNHSQREFYALDLNGNIDFSDFKDDANLPKFQLKDAEKDGTLYHLGSVYSPDNDVIYDGISRPGVRLVSFAPILKLKTFPLAEILTLVIESGGYGMGGPVEIEFAVNLSVPRGADKEFAVLQMRPMALDRETEPIAISELDKELVMCYTDNLLGVGSLTNIYDILVVDINMHDRSHSRETAVEIEKFNQILVKEKRPYILIGVGRWGSADPWLGIPVKWDQISGARVIVESGFADIVVEPSQGTHFFHNLIAFSVGYFLVKANSVSNWIDWDWLSAQSSFTNGSYINHLRFADPLVVKMNSFKNQGVIYKPNSLNEDI